MVVIRIMILQAEQTATDVHCGYLSILFCCQQFSHFLGLGDRPQAGGLSCPSSVNIHPRPPKACWKQSVHCSLWLSFHPSLCDWLVQRLQCLCWSLGTPNRVIWTQQFFLMTCLSSLDQGINSHFFFHWNPAMSSLIQCRFKANTVLRNIPFFYFLFVHNQWFLIFNDFLIFSPDCC